MMLPLFVKRNLLQSYWLILSFILSASVVAQAPAVKYLGIENGLSNNAVNTIFQDHNGFMWFGTYDGLNRYDGYQFKTFRNIIGDSTSINANNISTIEEDIDHNLWCGGQKGISIYNPGQSKFSSPRYLFINGKQTNLLNDNVIIIKRLKNGDLLAGTQHNGLFVFKKGTNVGRQIPLIAGGNNKGNYDVNSIVYDSKNHLAYLFIQNTGLFTYELNTQKLELKSSAIKQGNCLELDQQGYVWLGSTTGLYYFNQVTATFSENITPQVHSIVDLCKDKDGALWIASNGDGVWVLPPNGKNASPFVSTDGRSLVNSNAIYSIYEDNEGRKWIGTLRGGINTIDSKSVPFKHIVYNSLDNSNLVNNFIFSFCEGSKNSLWIGTDGAGLRYWDRTSNSFKNYVHNPNDPNSVSSNFITSIVKDFNKDIWVSTWFGGINRLKKSGQGFEHYSCFNSKNKSYDNNIWLLFEDSKKRLWASASTEGSLYLLNRQTNSFENFDPAITNLQCMAEDDQGNIWGGDYSSLVKLDLTNKKHTFYNIGHVIRSIHQDKKKSFWVGTQDGGLLLLDRKTGKFKRYTTSNGLPSNTILRIIEDTKGNLWLSTYNGLSRFDPKTQVFRNFYQSDGLQSNEFSFNAGLALTSGEIVFGGIKGFNIFHPDSIYVQSQKLNVFLAGLRIDNEEVVAENAYVTGKDHGLIREITIPFDRAVISLDYLALQYSGADKVKYAYYLEGWDKHWNYVQNTRTANYSRLREGDYTFKVKVSNPAAGWGNELALIRIIVLPPWYRTWWAYLAYILIGGAIIYIYLLYKNKQAKLQYEVKVAHIEAQKEKELHENKISFFTNVSHEFRTPLTLIINPIKDLIRKSKDDQSPLADDLNVIYRNAHRLLRLVDQLLLFRKVESESDQMRVSLIDLVVLCRDVFEYFVQQAKRNNIDYQFLCEAQSIELYGDYEKLEVAFFNLLSNAFKFTPRDGSISLKIREDGENVLVIIRDSGPGIPAHIAGKIFDKFHQSSKNDSKKGFGIGLYLVRHFINNHKGSVTCKSEPGEGAEFTITLKKGNVHFDSISMMENDVARNLALPETLIELDELPVASPAPEKLKEGLTSSELVTEKRSILFIDDNEEIRKYLGRILERQYLYYEASNGEEGLALAAKVFPDLIISDINMDGMNGFELCTAIKNNEELSHIPIILLTASLASDMKLKGVELGADEYITKPFEQDLLMAKIQNILNNRNILQRYFFDKITLKASTVKVPEEYQYFIKKCIEIVEENLGDEDFNVKRLSQLMGMSHSALYKKVKSISGQSISAFISSIKFRRAAVLMLSSNCTISQAAFQVGIKDMKFFREKFVQLFGMNPSAYIKKYRPIFNKDLNTITGQ
ncbi:response regulator [Chitinophagaceae bacterium LB-8]|uniref:histidine kinase n=1 Tax=Paraflavisolibacter caeni TaxID=2982496 RepID=A0A9X3BI31_9BACT|nr:two-component regulator propeller domain-containing protein [Paraflavisolibacter caeni]MCU7549608.1 response regulator [Paraflavisolibacter caeni]